MTSTISVVVGGTETVLSSLGAIVSHTGWGMPENESFASRAPGQHGDTYEGFSLLPRIGGLIFRMTHTELDDMYVRRDQLLSLFSPLNSMILKFNTPVGVRQFDCHFYGDMKMDWAAADWGAQPFGIQLKANNPAAYDPVGEAYTFSLGGGGNSLVIPMTMPMFVGSSTIDSTQIITYLANWYAYPVIRITGPATDPIIRNTATNEVLDFTGYTVTAGHYYDIDCRFGLKTVTSDLGVYKNSELTDASNLATFHIAPPSKTAGGINPIRVTASAVTQSSKVEFSFFKQFLGV